jgi:hypothetical protein
VRQKAGRQAGQAEAGSRYSTGRRCRKVWQKVVSARKRKAVWQEGRYRQARYRSQPSTNSPAPSPNGSAHGAR